MPYIEPERKEIYDRELNIIKDRLYHTAMFDMAGDFTYIVFSLLKLFNRRFWARALGIGCLVCAILEIYRRDHTEYEDDKIRQNGDVQ